MGNVGNCPASQSPDQNRSLRRVSVALYLRGAIPKTLFAYSQGINCMCDISSSDLTPNKKKSLLSCSCCKHSWCGHVTVEMPCPGPSGYRHLLELQRQGQGEASSYMRVNRRVTLVDSWRNRVPTTHVVSCSRPPDPIRHPVYVEALPSQYATHALSVYRRSISSHNL